MGLSRSRHRFVLVVAILLATTFGTLFAAGPVLANPPTVKATTAAALPATQALTRQPASSKTTASTAQIYTTKKPSATSAETTPTPVGSPLSVQLATIAILLALGFAYFRVMGGSGRRVPVTKTERASLA
ncbi:hypothetical protein [Arthrobacter dokdonensis]|uniref:hypothetical protein n=1 Tax=Arthrobacter dokdonellae TaxID=2211210 RepID=UPI000DE5A791|nr:hypothetical protein [Arthrobacter dokdonellae]